MKRWRWKKMVYFDARERERNWEREYSGLEETHYTLIPFPPAVSIP